MIFIAIFPCASTRFIRSAADGEISYWPSFALQQLDMNKTHWQIWGLRSSWSACWYRWYRHLASPPSGRQSRLASFTTEVPCVFRRSISWIWMGIVAADARATAAWWCWLREMSRSWALSSLPIIVTGIFMPGPGIKLAVFPPRHRLAYIACRIISVTSGVIVDNVLSHHHLRIFDEISAALKFSSK